MSACRSAAGQAGALQARGVQHHVLLLGAGPRRPARLPPAGPPPRAAPPHRDGLHRVAALPGSLLLQHGLPLRREGLSKATPQSAWLYLSVHSSVSLTLLLQRQGYISLFNEIQITTRINELRARSINSVKINATFHLNRLSKYYYTQLYYVALE